MDKKHAACLGALAVFLVFLICIVALVPTKNVILNQPCMVVFSGSCENANMITSSEKKLEEDREHHVVQVSSGVASWQHEQWEKKPSERRRVAMLRRDNQDENPYCRT